MDRGQKKLIFAMVLGVLVFLGVGAALFIAPATVQTSSAVIVVDGVQQVTPAVTESGGGFPWVIMIPIIVSGVILPIMMARQQNADRDRDDKSKNEDFFDDEKPKRQDAYFDAAEYAIGDDGELVRVDEVDQKRRT